MAELLNGNQQWVDTGGSPLAGGKVYIGDQDADPVLNPKDIFSDRALTTAISNPQVLDAEGFSVNKIWLSGRYSIRVEDAVGVLVEQELDNGEADLSILSSVSNVAGVNSITGDNTPTITEYIDQALFVFQVFSGNTTDAVTLNIDSVGAKTIQRNFDQGVGIGKFKAGQSVMVIYNSANDNFEWINENARINTETEGADLVAASTVDLALATGNNLTVTGNTTITGFGTVLAGVIFNLTFSGTPTITHNATSLILPTKDFGSRDIIIRPGDTLTVQSLGSGNFKVINFQSEVVTALLPTGMVAPTIGTTAPSSWILLNGGTIGNGSSGATRANVDTNALFNLFWDSMADGQAPVSSGRGGSAQADFDADKTLTVPDARGKVAAGTGGTAFTTHGDTGGEETHQLSTANMPAHTHAQRRFTGSSTVTNNIAVNDFAITPVDLIISTGSTGGGGSHNNLQPWLALTWICKL